MTSSFWQGRPTLVTGATGLLGSWLVRRLIGLGADVICLVRDWVPQSVLLGSEMTQQCILVRGDVLDQAVMERALGEYEITTLFHLAAQTIVGIANRNPISTLESNVRGTWTVLEACRRSPQLQAIVIASSDKAYGEQERLPYDERTPLRGRHPYDVSKSCADLISQMYAATYGLPVAITRCGNLFGGGDLNWNRVVPGTIRSVLRRQRPIIRSNGSYVRDYFYVEDAASAYMLLAEHVSQNASCRGEAYNFSNQSPLTVTELVHRILRLMGSDLQPVVLDEATGEIYRQYLSATRAREQLGWCPSFSLDEGLLRTLDWYRRYLSHG